MTFEMIRKQVSENVPFARLAGVRVGDVTRGCARASLTVRPEIENHVGTMHAAALFALGETASGAAMASTLAPVILGVTPVASGASIQYLKAARGEISASSTFSGEPDALVAELRACGKVQFNLDVEMRDSHDELVANMAVQWHVKLKR